MAIPLPVLDDRTFEDLRRDLVAEIPLVAQDWTDHNPSDPGMAVLELLAAMAEMLIYRLDRIPAAVTENALRMIVDRPEPVMVELQARRNLPWAPLATLPVDLEFPQEMTSRIRFDAARGRLEYRAVMTEGERTILENLPADAGYLEAIAVLFARSNRSVILPAGTRVRVPALRAVRFLGGRRGVAVGHAGTILLTEDGGRHWTTQPDIEMATLAAMHFADSARGWAVGAAGLILATTDGGTTWGPRATATTADLAAVDFADAATGWAVGGAATILATADAGATWIPQPVAQTEDLAGVAFVDALTGIAVGAGGLILRTTNGGTAWGVVASGTTEWLNAVHFASPTRGWIVGEGGVILRTDDAGASWARQTSAIADDLFAADFSDERTGRVAGAGGVVLVTDNAGELWTTEPSGTTATIRGLAHRGSQQAWAVTDHGSIVATSDGGRAWASQRHGGTFETVRAAEISSGTLSVGVPARHVEEMPDRALGLADGTADQRFPLLDSAADTSVRPILLDPLQAASLVYTPNPEITVDGVPWRYVEDLLDVGPEPVFTVEWLTYDVVFGDGVRGAVPPAGAQVRCPRHQVVCDRTAQVAAGSLTQLERSRVRLAALPFAAGALPVLPSVRFDAGRGVLEVTGPVPFADRAALLSVPPDPGTDPSVIAAYAAAVEAAFEVADLSFVNPADAIGGRYLFDMASAASDGLRERRHRERAVNVGDYAHLAATVFNALNGVPNVLGIRRAHAQRLDDNGSVAVVIIPESSGAADRWPVPSEELKRKLFRFLDSRRLITTRLFIGDPQYRPVAVALTLMVQPSVDRTAIAQRIAATINRFFDPIDGGVDGTGWPLGRGVYRSEVFQKVMEMRAVDDVRSVRLDGADRSFVVLRPLELPRIEMRAPVDIVFEEPTP